MRSFGRNLLELFACLWSDVQWGWNQHTCERGSEWSRCNTAASTLCHCRSMFQLWDGPNNLFIVWWLDGRLGLFTLSRYFGSKCSHKSHAGVRVVKLGCGSHIWEWTMHQFITATRSSDKVQNTIAMTSVANQENIFHCDQRRSHVFSMCRLSISMWAIPTKLLSEFVRWMEFLVSWRSCDQVILRQSGIPQQHWRRFVYFLYALYSLSMIVQEDSIFRRRSLMHSENRIIRACTWICFHWIFSFEAVEFMLCWMYVNACSTWTNWLGPWLLIATANVESKICRSPPFSFESCCGLK